MKLSNSFLLMTFLSLSLIILPQHTVACYGRFLAPQIRILQTTGDLTLPANSFVISDIYTVYYQFDPADVANATNSTDTNVTNSTGTDVANATGTDLTNSTSTNLTDNTNGTLVDGTSTNSTDLVPPLNGTNETDATNGVDITTLPNATVIDNTTTPAEPVPDNNTVPGGILNATDNTIITNGIVGDNLDNITEPILTTEPDSGANTTDTTGNGTDITNEPVMDNATGLTNGTSTNDTALTNGTDITNGTALVNSTGATNGTDITNGTSLTNGTDINNATGIDNGTNTTNGTVAAGPPVYITVAINFTVPNQFFGLGWGSTGMIGGDIWSFEIVDGVVVVNDRMATGHFEPPTDVEQGGTNDVEVLGYDIGATYTFVKVRRLIDTGDVHDNVIAPGLNNVIWATDVGSPTINYHGPTKGALQVDLITV